MNVLFLTISCIQDVSERGIYTDLMREFVARGHNVHIMCPFERKIRRKTELYQSGEVTILGVKTLNIQKTNPIEKGIATLLLEYQFMRAMKKYLKNTSFDLVLYSTPPVTFNKVVEYVKRKYGAKSYLLLKDIFPQNAVDLGMFSKSSLFYKLFRSKEKTLYRISDYIGCMSPANVEFVLKHNPTIDAHKVHINPNSIKLVPSKSVDREALRQKYGLPIDKTIFIYGGNLGKPQGVEFLLQVLNHYKKDERLYFVVVGNGTEYPKIERWFASEQPANARLMPRLPKKEYDNMVQSCDVGLIFLNREFTIPNYPSRLLSYLEYKMPIIAATDVNSDMGVLAEKNGYGFWSENGDLEGFVANVERILQPANLLRMGQCGYDFLVENYTVEKSYEIVMQKISSYV